MKNYIIINIFLFLFIFQGVGQDFYTPQISHEDFTSSVNTSKKKRLRNFKISLSAGYLDIKDYQFGMGGIGLEFFVGKHMSLNYNFSLGTSINSNNHFNFHGAAGASTGSLFITAALLNNAIDESLDNALSSATGKDVDMSKGLTRGLGITGVILILIPEGLSYHIDMGKHLSISPYVNPLGLDYMGSDKIIGQKLALSYEVGSAVNFYFKNKRYLSPKIGLRGFYGTPNNGYLIGLNYGFYF